MPEPRGAGKSGGLLFLAVMLFVAYLAITALAGAARLMIGTALLVVVILLALNVFRR